MRAASASASSASARRKRFSRFIPSPPTPTSTHPDPRVAEQCFKELEGTVDDTGQGIENRSSKLSSSCVCRSMPFLHPICSQPQKPKQHTPQPKQPNAVPDADLLKLGLLLGRNWPKALQLVERGAVHCFQGAPSGRRVFQVSGRAAAHTTLPRHYCTCQAHHYEVVVKGDTPYVSSPPRWSFFGGAKGKRQGRALLGSCCGALVAPNRLTFALATTKKHNTPTPSDSASTSSRRGSRGSSRRARSRWSTM